MSKSNRRGGDDRREKDREDYPRKQPYPQQEATTVPGLDEFFLDGEGIDRQVLQSSICRFLGPEATCKPKTIDNRKGYIIRAIRTFTPAMLQDLKERSTEFETENQNSHRQHGGIGPLNYEESETIRRDARRDPHGGHRDTNMMDYEPSLSPIAPYNQGSHGMAYPQAGNQPNYAAQYGQDPSMLQYSNTGHPSNAYGHTYGTYPPPNNSVQAYADGRTYPQEYSYTGSSMPQGPQYGQYGQGYVDASRNPNYGQNYPYVDPSRGMGPPIVPGPGIGQVSGQPYAFPPTTQAPRVFDDPNNAFHQRQPNQGNDRYGAQPPGGPGAYGEGQRDREGRDQRDRDPYKGSSADYAPSRRR